MRITKILTGAAVASAALLTLAGCNDPMGSEGGDMGSEPTGMMTPEASDMQPSSMEPSGMESNDMQPSGMEPSESMDGSH